jgi:hypothetical protein
MAANNDMFNLQYGNGVPQNAQAIEISHDNLIGNIAMYEYLAGLGIDNAFGGNPAVGAADPENIWFLLPGQPGKKIRVPGGNSL